MAGDGGKNVSARSDGEDEGEIGPAQQSQIADHPQRQRTTAGQNPGVEKRSNVVSGRSGDGSTNFLHAVTKTDVSHHIREHNNSCEQVGFRGECGRFALLQNRGGRCTTSVLVCQVACLRSKCWKPAIRCSGAGKLCRSGTFRSAAYLPRKHTRETVLFLLYLETAKIRDAGLHHLEFH